MISLVGLPSSSMLPTETGITCARCKRPVERLERNMSFDPREEIFVLHCHGVTRTVRIATSRLADRHAWFELVRRELEEAFKPLPLFRIQRQHPTSRPCRRSRIACPRSRS
jgi:hypothetical protein